MEELIEIQSRDYWYKVVEMLQQNWALVDTFTGTGCKVFFIGDNSGVFDVMEFSSLEKASVALKRNGFAMHAENQEIKGIIVPPEPPFYQWEHPNGPIYSSGRFWRNKLIDFIGPYISRHPSLSLKVNKGNRHRIMKTDWRGSLWVTPRYDGYRLLTTGDVSIHLHPKIIKMFGDNNAEDQGKKIWYIDDRQRIKKIIDYYGDLQL